MVNRDHRLTTVELIIVSAILALLGMQAVPRFLRPSVISQQREARETLEQIYLMQRAYRAQHGTYYLPAKGVAASAANRGAFAPIHVTVAGNAPYRYTIEAAGAGFVARAEAASLDADPTPDEWSIDQRGVLVQVFDDARR